MPMAPGFSSSGHLSQAGEQKKVLDALRHPKVKRPALEVQQWRFVCEPQTETHRQEVEALAVSFRHQHSGVNRQARLRLQAHLHEVEPTIAGSA